jgi:large subunit ribosomal protein L30
MATDLKVTQVRSAIGRPEAARRVLRGMGLRRVNQSVILPDTPAVRGMIFKVPHLVKVERAAAGEHRRARPREATEDQGTSSSSTGA